MKEGTKATSDADLVEQSEAIARWLLANTEVATESEPIVAVVGGALQFADRLAARRVA